MSTRPRPQKIHVFEIARPPHILLVWKTADGKTHRAKVKEESTLTERLAVLEAEGIIETRVTRTPQSSLSYLVKWRVDGRDKTRAFPNKARAQKFHRDLNNAIDARERFDTESGLPVSWIAGDTVATTAVTYVHSRWKGASPTTRQHYELVFTRVVTALLKPGTKRYGDPIALESYVRTKLLRPPIAGGGTATLDAAEQKAARWLERYSLPIADLEPKNILAVIDVLGVNQGQGRSRQRHRGRPNSARTVATYMTYVKAWVTMCVSLELVHRNPLKNPEVVRAIPVYTQKKVKKSRAMTPAQVIALAEEVATLTPQTSRYRAPVLLIGSTGLRIGEVIGLRRRDLVLPETGWGCVTVARQLRRAPNVVYTDNGARVESKPPKGRTQEDAPREVPLHPVIVAELLDHLERYQPDTSDNALVFTNTVGKHVDVSHFEGYWNAAAARLWPYNDGLSESDQHPLCGVTPHDGRHAAVSLFVAAGVDTARAQEWTGHRRLSTFTDVYTHLLDEGSDEALQRLDDALRRKAPEFYDRDGGRTDGDGGDEDGPNLRLVG